MQWPVQRYDPDRVQLRRAGRSPIVRAEIEGFEVKFFDDGRTVAGTILRPGARSIHRHSHKNKIAFSAEFATADEGRERVTSELRALLQDPRLYLSHITEAFSWPAVVDGEPDAVPGDKFITCTLHDTRTDTLQLVPERIPLIVWERGHPVLSDHGDIPYRPQVERGYMQYLQSIKGGCEPSRRMGWLAWLINERIRQVHPHRDMVVADTLCMDMWPAPTNETGTALCDEDDYAALSLTG